MTPRILLVSDIAFQQWQEYGYTPDNFPEERWSDQWKRLGKLDDLHVIQFRSASIRDLAMSYHLAGERCGFYVAEKLIRDPFRIVIPYRWPLPPPGTPVTLTFSRPFTPRWFVRFSNPTREDP